MHRNNKPEDVDEQPKSRTSSRRNSASSGLSRKNSAKKDYLRKPAPKSPNTTPGSSQSTPKKTAAKPEKLDFLVTGKQLLKRCDRANSLPGVYRRPSVELGRKRSVESRRAANVTHSSKSRDTSLEDDMSLDLSQVSDFEDTNSKYGLKKRFSAVATSTPKPGAKPRSGSLAGQQSTPRCLEEKSLQSAYSSVQSALQSARDSYKTSSAVSNSRRARSTELDYSSVSPECSGQSSADLSPRTSQQHSVLSDIAVASPYSQRSQLSSSSCYMSWVDSAEDRTKTEKQDGGNGEWNCFWANYNSSAPRPLSRYYDQCPTPPYASENKEGADLVSAAGSTKRSPAHNAVHRVIRTEGLHLTAGETQSLIKCTHILGNVLSKAIDRGSRQIEQEVEEKPQGVAKTPDPEVELKKKAFTLDLREQSKPSQVEIDKKCETVTTQTDISLPNTKSAPRIFEKILRQLSRTSLEEAGESRKEDRGGGGESERKDDRN